MVMTEIKLTGRGVCIGGFTAGGAKDGKYGVAIIKNNSVCRCAALFTRNSLKAAPVLVSRENVKNGIQAIVANSGNANACTPNGLADAKKMCRIAAGALSVDEKNIAVASTGIIGRLLDMGKVEALIGEVSGGLSAGKSPDAARAIMTTDTVKKEISVEYKGIEVGAIAKGVGMVCPGMATVLCFVTTNANLSDAELYESLKSAADSSLNMLIVDGDMSTNDCLFLLSEGTKKCSALDFRHALDYVLVEITKMLARDGEGATKLIEADVIGGETPEIARTCARAIVTSPLVKTAIYGENPNWGRIAAAVGSVADVDFENLEIRLKSENGEATTLKKGQGGDLKQAEAVLRGKEILIIVNMNSGNGKARAFGCDLTPGYVKINAEYN
ncbi:MAG: hypothetical protein MSIBF_05475 [Candidatus Altiarchaeales archaeon IMC4]|nr:MAG: hypothetical protein MSIBF_05475 [Candidatus Altiarchaeales archaeon IMC4]